jgi:hypothetical protein
MTSKEGVWPVDPREREDRKQVLNQIFRNPEMADAWMRGQFALDEAVEGVRHEAFTEIAGLFRAREEQLKNEEAPPPTNKRDHRMPDILYLTIPIVVEEAPSQRRINNLAKEARDAFMVNVEPEEIGLLKVKDLDFDVRPPFGHKHHSEGRSNPCQHNENNCYEALFDGVHVPEED